MIDKIANKKGISPLIATVLLVGVVIVIALIVWFWYGQVIKGATDKSGIQAIQACAKDVDFEIKSICKISSTNTLRFNVENKGIPIGRFKLTFTGSNGAKALDTSIGVSTGTTQDITINYPTSSEIGTFQKAQITPFIISGNPIYCEEQTKELSSIQEC